MSAAIKNRLSVRDISGKPQVPADMKPVYLCDVYGIATESFDMPDRFDATKVSHGFKGDFRGLDHATGNLFQAGKLFLPAVVENLLLPAVKATKEGGVKFAFRIGVVKVADPKPGQVGYQLVAESLLPVSENDQVSEMEKAIPALAGPGKVAQIGKSK